MPRRVSILVLVTLVACEPPAETDPSNAQVVSEDVPRFWAAFDEGTDAATLQRRYLDPGSPHLRSFLASRITNAARLSETVTRNRGYYASIRDNTLSVATPEWTVGLRQVFARAKELDPDATFPPTALLIGRMNSGGTTSASGILIGLELYSLAPDSPRDTLNSFEEVAVQSNEALVALIAHEHVHTQQELHRMPRAVTVLEQCVFEGMADFISEKTSGHLINPAMYAWARAHEAELKVEFEAARSGTDASRWLYDQGKDPNRPGDLGYFMGYRICEAWAARFADDAQAVQALLRASDLTKLALESGYLP